MHKYLLFVLLLGCPQQPPSPPVPDADAMTPVVTDAAAPASEAAPSDACGLAEQKMLQLGCKDPRGRLLGGPNLHGTPWSQICRDNKANGTDMKPECIVVQTTCQGVETCR